jgi:hypothetical protein
VTVSTAGNSPGRLHGWIDFDQDGRFESSERVVANLLLGAGSRSISFIVPADAATGATFARFRYGYETDLGPTGSSLAGEVEDYRVTVLPSLPVAVRDEFPLPGQPLIREDSVNYPLDVLANDPNTIFGPPQIVPGSFPAVLPGTGSTLVLNAAGDRILYTAGPDVEAGDVETFTYQVTDGQNVSAPGQVFINVALANPVALDDTFTLAASDGFVTAQLPVMANDLFPIANTTIIGTPIFISQGGATQQSTLEVSGTDPTVLNFGTTTAAFRGTQIYQYTIDDDDPTTLPSTAFVTIQVVDPGASDAQLVAAGYDAELNVVLLDEQGNPTTNLTLDQGDIFSVQVTGRDLRPGGLDENRGVLAAYMDLLFDRAFVEPVLDPSNPLGFAIEFSSDFDESQSGVPNDPADGQINEVGAAQGQGALATGRDEIPIFTVQLRAVAPTGGTPTRIVGDPADQVNLTVVVEGEPTPEDPLGSPIDLTDYEVFLRQSGDITIFGAGEGLFVNRENPLDVTQDGDVAPNDVLTVINNLNLGGARSLRAGGSAPITGAQGMVDVNMDSMLSPIDALVVINYLNSRPRTHHIGGEGEGEAAVSGSAAASGAAVDQSLLGLVALDAGDMDAGVGMESDPAVILDQPSQHGTGETGGAAASPSASSTAVSSAPIDAAAADDVFAELATARTILKQKYRR